MTKLTQHCNYHWYVQESESRTRNQRVTQWLTRIPRCGCFHIFLIRLNQTFPPLCNLFGLVWTQSSRVQTKTTAIIVLRESGLVLVPNKPLFFVVGTWSNLNLAQLPAVRLTNSMLLYMLNISSLAVFSHLKEGSTSLQSVKQYGIFKTVSRSAFGTVLV